VPVHRGGGPAETVPVTTPRGRAVAMTLARGNRRAALREGGPAAVRVEQEGVATSAARAGVHPRGVRRYASATTGSRGAASGPRGAAAMHPGAWEALDEASMAGRLSERDGFL